ncbi:hypothetical protein Tco_0421243 [Tanacetum coccineum]
MENVGLTFAQVSSKARHEGVGLRVADSHTGNHPKGDFTPFETIRRFLVAIRRRPHSGFEGEAFTLKRRLALSLRGSLANNGMLSLWAARPSLGFGIGSPSALVNTEPPKDVKEAKVQPAKVTTDSGKSLKGGVFVVHPGSVAARIKERRCKTRGCSSRPPVKRKLASGSSSSRVVRAKTFASKDDAPFLSISDEDEGLPDCFELKDANACHLKISAITPPAWRGHLDNQMDLELLDRHDRCYARSHKEECEWLRAKCEAAMAEFDQNPAVLALWEKISSLSAEVKEHKGNLDMMMLESQKWAGYQVTLSALESKVTSLEADKARLEAVEASLRTEIKKLRQDRRDLVSKVVPYAAMELVHSDELGRLVGKLVSSAITYGRCRAYEQVAAMKEPFDLSKVKAYRSS